MRALATQKSRVPLRIPTVAGDGRGAGGPGRATLPRPSMDGWNAVLVLLAEWWWVAPAGAARAGSVGRRCASVSRPAGGSPSMRRATSCARREHALTRVPRRGRACVSAAGAARGGESARSGTVALGAVLEAKRRVQLAHRQVKAAVAELRARRASCAAARATMPASRAPLEAMPLARLRAEHDAADARWIAYETDPAKAIDVPGDERRVVAGAAGRSCASSGSALELRPSSASARGCRPRSSPPTVTRCAERRTRSRRRSAPPLRDGGGRPCRQPTARTGARSCRTCSTPRRCDRALGRRLAAGRPPSEARRESSAARGC